MSELGNSGSDLQRNTHFTDGAQVGVTGTRKKFHRPMHEKIMEGYDEFNAYVIVTGYKTSTDWRFKRPENGYPKTKVVNI